MSELRFEETRQGDVLIVAVHGEIGITASSAFQKKLAALVAAGETRLILDLEKTSYITSSGLGAISQAAKDIRQKGGTLCLARVHYLSREVMTFFGLMPIVNICDDIDDALSLLTKTPKR